MAMSSFKVNKLFNRLHIDNKFCVRNFNTCRIFNAGEHLAQLPPVEDKCTEHPNANINKKIKPAFRKQNWKFRGKLWKAYEEIPYHYREGVNKEQFTSPVKKMQIKKYKNRYEERNFYRTAQQRLRNSGKSLLPYDKSMPVITGKHTGPGVEGGTVLAQKLAALHVVQPTGYVNKKGKFKFVEDMVPEFVVPELKEFKLKPYVSYRATEINQTKLTARSLFNSFYADKAKNKWEQKYEMQLEEPKTKQTKVSKLLPWKKSSE